MTDVTVTFTAEQYERLLKFERSFLKDTIAPLVSSDELSKRNYPKDWQPKDETEYQRHLEALRLHKGIVAALEAKS